MDRQRPMASKFNSGGFGGLSSPLKYPHNALESSMSRSNAPKYASYYGDGWGRDSYIILNNGGLAGATKQNMMRTSFRSTVRGSHCVPSKQAAVVTYLPDGSGRDSYVAKNSGGLVNDYCRDSERGDVAFVGSLRKQSRNLLPYFRDSGADANITNYLNWPSSSAKKHQAL